MTAQGKARLEDLERRFGELEPRLRDTPEKEAISILHAMLIENRRQQGGGYSAAAGAPASRQPESDSRQPESDAEYNRGGRTLDDIANLYKSAPAMQGRAENQGLPVGSQAPDFSLHDAAGRRVSLNDFRGKKVVLAFYPLDWSPACSDQLSLYQSELANFKQQGAQVIAVSVDSLYSHGARAAVRGITFPLLADFNPKGETARRYHVYRESDGFSERALYVIDDKGIIRYSHVAPELHMIPDVYELFDELQKLNSGAGPVPAR